MTALVLKDDEQIVIRKQAYFNWDNDKKKTAQKSTLWEGPIHVSGYGMGIRQGDCPDKITIS